VKAKSLRFGGRPDVNVEFQGDSSAEARTVSGSERENLPERVEPGVTYRNIEVRWAAAAWIAESGEHLPDAASDDASEGRP
jgi:hypothetical protein